jgi:hypothetical protein
VIMICVEILTVSVMAPAMRCSNYIPNGTLSTIDTGLNPFLSVNFNYE